MKKLMIAALAALVVLTGCNPQESYAYEYQVATPNNDGTVETTVTMDAEDIRQNNDAVIVIGAAIIAAAVAASSNSSSNDYDYDNVVITSEVLVDTAYTADEGWAEDSEWLMSYRIDSNVGVAVVEIKVGMASDTEIYQVDYNGGSATKSEIGMSNEWIQVDHATVRNLTWNIQEEASSLEVRLTLGDDTQYIEQVK